MELRRRELKGRSESILWGSCLPLWPLFVSTPFQAQGCSCTPNSVHFKHLGSFHRFSFIPEEPQRTLESLEQSSHHEKPWLKTSHNNTRTDFSCPVLAVPWVVPLLQRPLVPSWPGLVTAEPSQVLLTHYPGLWSLTGDTGCYPSKVAQLQAVIFYSQDLAKFIWAAFCVVVPLALCHWAQCRCHPGSKLTKNISDPWQLQFFIN